MDNRFLKYLNFLIELEGGYSNHKNDKGGVTYNGITQTTYSSYRKKYNKRIKIY